MSGLERCQTIDELKREARRRVPKMFFEYVDAGSWTGSTYRANQDDFEKILFRQRVARDLSVRNLSSSMLGHATTLPLALAPTGLTGMQSADGEIKAARAAARFGVPFTLSTMSICSIEDVAENTDAPFWFQVYMMKDRAFMARLIDRARAAKCPVLVLTMDLQILGARHKDRRNGMEAPPRLTPRFLFELAAKPRWALGMLGTRRHSFGNLVGHAKGADTLSDLAKWTASQFDLTLDWSDVGWVKERFGGPVIVKGVLDPEDAQLAVAGGADAIIVSNHGGRQLDGAPSSIRVLPEIVDRLKGKTEIFVDGGIQSGQDLLKALALGAKGVFIGRAFLYGLGAGGEAGVTRALEIIRRDADVTLALLGERDITALGPHNIYANGLVNANGPLG